MPIWKPSFALACGEVRELYALRPDRMAVVSGAGGWPDAYDYPSARDGAHDAGRFGFLPVLHLKFFNPLDDHYGFRPLEAAAMAIDVHNAASAWNKALLDNAARPSGALVYNGTDGAASVRGAIRSAEGELDDAYQGRAAGRPLLLEGGLDWKPMSLTPADMDFINGEARGRARDRAGLRRAADAAGHSRRQHLSNYHEANALLAPDGAAAGGAHAVR